jgi:DNA polymerase-3 subunit beta
MQITCKQQELSRALAIVNHAISSRSTLPILSHILLSATEKGLELSATNLEIGIHCWIEAQVRVKGNIAVPARVTTDFVSSLPVGEVELTTAQDEDSVHVKSTRSSAIIRGMDATEFPIIPGAENGTDPITLEATLLKKAIAEVAFAAAQDDARPILTSVLVRVQNEQMTLVSSNGFCLAMRRLSLPGYGETYDDLLIPARTLQELARILPSTGDVQMIVTPDRSQVLFHTEQIDLVSRLIEGTYFNVNGILPKDYTTRAVIETKEFAATLRSVVPFAQDSSNITQLKISGNETMEGSTLTIEASAEEIGTNVSRIDATIDGPAQELLFNVRYLTSVLSVIDTPEVAIEITSKTRPGLLRPVGAVDAQYVIMPMAVNVSNLNR